MRLHLPSEFSEAASLRFLNQLPSFVAEQELVLDFSRVAFARPYGTLLIAEAIRYLQSARARYGLGLRYSENGVVAGPRTAAVSYLGHIGFFRRVGIPFGNEPAQALGSSSYLPITPISREGLQATGEYGALQRAIETESERLAKVVSVDEQCVDMLAYCFREIIRNVFEHAETPECVVTAQKWPSKKQVELAIVDRGRGVHASLLGAYADINPAEAVQMALRPGITRRAGAPEEGVWDNTGFGLYVTSELCRQYGRFTVVSSGRALSVAPYHEELRDAFFPGTAIRLLIDIEDAEYFGNLLASIVRRGEDTSRVPHTKASSASKRPKAIEPH